MTDMFQADAPLPGDSTCSGPIWYKNLDRIKFLGYNAKIVKQHSGQALLGVSLSASCRPCLYYALHENCRPASGFTGNYGLDFITLVSHLSSINTEPYGHMRWLSTEKPDWFDKLGGEAVDSVKVGLFYVLHEEGVAESVVDQARILIQQYASGYFAVERINVNSGNGVVPVTNSIE